MLSKFFLILFFFVISFTNGQAQNDPVLFTVDDIPVHVSEFKYIYSKTNGADADFSKKSLEEYLDLYTKFKLKVRKAKELQIDTIPALKRELEGYRKQLSDSYLMDKGVKDKLLKTAYERLKKDVNISHIMVNIRGRKQPKDVKAAYNKIIAIQKELDNGASFEKLATKKSEDAYSKKGGGLIGWVTAVLPNGFYEMENAAYQTKVGEYSKPFKTDMGYHILNVNEVREARGNIELAHIVVFNPKKPGTKDAKAIINKAYADLKSGGDFDQIARLISNDKKSAAKGGYLGFHGIGVHEKSFEDAAFTLQNDGDYSAPIQTSTGWHIIKRVSKPKLGTFREEKNRLQAQIERDSRFKEARIAMIKKIKKENNFSVNQKVLDSFTKGLDNSFYTTKWKVANKSNEVLFSFGAKQQHTLGEFTDFLFKSTKDRINKRRKHTATELTVELLDKFSNQKALAYENAQLSEKYPAFRSLMREYEEGIILFEVTKMLIWDKASKDTSGLSIFYDQHQDNYLWEERAEITIYTLKSQSEKILAKTRKLAKRKGSDTVLKKINKKGNLLDVTTGKAEKGKKSFPSLDDMNWKKGRLSKSNINDDNTVSFVKIEQVLPRKKKALKDAKGYVISDYQDELEVQWIEELQDTYPVKVNQAVFNSLIK